MNLNWIRWVLSVSWLILGEVTLASPIRLVMDCGKKEAYVGEKLICQFILSAPDDYLDVEVVKFPEFRGYWSENLALRQGQLGLVPMATPNGLTKVVAVGSYSIHKMIDNGPGEIIPMKISVKPAVFGLGSRDSRENADVYFSDPLPMRWIPLPPVPKPMEQKPFKGAVGQFASTQTDISVPYRLEEPIQLRLSIQGRGNFSEINSIPLKLPENSELLSHRSFLQSNGDISTKTFEYSILLKSSPPSEWNLGAFLYFDPQKRAYETFPLPKVLFSPAPITEKSESFSFLLPTPESQWTASIALTDSPLFWGSQLLLLGVLLGLSLKNCQQSRRLKWLSSAEFKRQQVWNQALEAQTKGDSQLFTQLATSMFTQMLREKIEAGHVRFNHYPTKRHFLSLMQNSLSAEQTKYLSRLFDDYDQLYSPNKNKSVNSSLPKDLDFAFKLTQK